MTGPSTNSMEIGLVLQGGGALGAYEYGGITALFDLMDEASKDGRAVALKAVTGVSIGAINAACVVGATDRADARRRLCALWNDLIIDAPAFMPAQVSRDLSLFGVERFYRMRYDVLTMPRWTYIYNTRPLLQTLADHVDFVALNNSETALVITAVDVESGTLTRFANRDIGETKGITIKPQHILASGSLPPQFPWTDIAGRGGAIRHYWDGGVVDNTPLGDAIDGFGTGAGVQRLLVVMNLFPEKARLPRSFAEVNERADALRFGNRLRQDSKSAQQINDLISTIEHLASLVPGELPPELRAKVDAASAYKLVEPIEVSLASDDVGDDEYGFRDFSRQGVEGRRQRGHDIALEKLRPAFASPTIVST